MADIFNLLNNAIVSASTWFVSIFNSSGMVDVYLSIIFIVLAMRFLLSPIFGSSRGSDKARSKDE